MSECKSDSKKAAGALAPAEVQGLSSTVDVATGAVVSRTLMKTEGGTVTVFAFDQGQSLSEHTAPFDALVHVIDGTLNVIIDGNESSVGGGELILMPANIPHAVTAPVPVKWMLVMLKSPEKS